MTLTKAELIEQLKSVPDDMPVYIRLVKDDIDCIISTEEDIIEEYKDKVLEDEDEEDIDIDTALQGLIEYDDSVEYIEIRDIWGN